MLILKIYIFSKQFKFIVSINKYILKLFSLWEKLISFNKKI